MLTALIVGALAGWLAGRIMNKKKSSFIIDIIIGIVGGFIGHFLLGLFGISTYNILGDIVAAVIGACILIWIIRKIGK